MPRPLDEVARSYAARVESLFEIQPGARAPRTTLSPDVVKRDDALDVEAAEFLASASADLRQGDKPAREDAAVRLLAKAVVDLDVAGSYLEAADAEAKAPPAPTPTPRGATGPRTLVRTVPPEDLEALLQPQTFASLARASATPAATAEDGREALERAVGTSLRTLSEKAANSGKQALTGVISQGLGSLGEIVGEFGMKAADLFGVKETVGWLVGLARKALIRVYDAIVALLGQAGVDSITKKLVNWFNHMTGDGFVKVVENQIYGIVQIASGLNGRIGSASDTQKLADAAAAVNQLAGAFEWHVRLADRFLGWLDDYAKYLTTPIPKLKLAVAVTYTLLGGYIILIGADYTDAQAWYVLDRTDGVSKTVEKYLS